MKESGKDLLEPNCCSISIGVPSRFGIISAFKGVDFVVKAVNEGRLDGDLDSERILGVSSIAVTVSDIEKESKGVLFIFGKASNLEVVLWWVGYCFPVLLYCVNQFGLGIETQCVLGSYICSRLGRHRIKRPYSWYLRNL